MSVTVFKLASGEEIIANVVNRCHLMEYINSKYVGSDYKSGQSDPQYGVVIQRPCIFDKEFDLSRWVFAAKPSVNEFFISVQHILFELDKNEMNDTLYENYIAYMGVWE